MILKGLHFLLTYQCTCECEHCFVWGSPWQHGTMTLAQVRDILRQAQTLGTIESIYFEGGEAFMYYPVLLRGVQQAVEKGFHVGIVSNAYWATSLEDATEWLTPLAGKISDLTVSSDLFHYSEKLSQQAQFAQAAAKQLGISTGLIQIAQPQPESPEAGVGQIPVGESGVMYRGRAAEKLAPRMSGSAWEIFTTCPYEDLVEPGRLHVDPFGYLHICQGISIGNLFHKPLTEIVAQYNPRKHPICGPLLAGGPAELSHRYGVLPQKQYADACHLCDFARHQLRARFPEILVPNEIYGEYQ